MIATCILPRNPDRREGLAWIWGDVDSLSPKYSMQVLVSVGLQGRALHDRVLVMSKLKSFVSPLES